MSKMSTKISIFNFFPDVSREVRGVLIYHQWSLGRGLEPPMINFFSKKKVCSRTSGNVLNGILTLSDRQTDPSGAHLGPFSFLRLFFYFGGIIGRPFRHSRLSRCMISPHTRGNHGGSGYECPGTWDLILY